MSDCGTLAPEPPERGARGGFDRLRRRTDRRRSAFMSPVCAAPILAAAARLRFVWSVPSSPPPVHEWAEALETIA